MTCRVEHGWSVPPSAPDAKQAIVISCASAGFARMQTPATVCAIGAQQASPYHLSLPRNSLIFHAEALAGDERPR
jgi:hypothetical protein